MCCGRGYDVVEGGFSDVQPVDVIYAAAVCAGVSTSNMHHKHNNKCVDLRSSGTGEIFNMLYKLMQTPKIKHSVKMVLGENGKHFERATERRTCMDSANEKLGKLGFDNLSCCVDARDFETAQSRERSHASWTPTGTCGDQAVYMGVLELLAGGPLPFSKFIEPFTVANCDSWLSKPLLDKRKAYRQDDAGIGMADIEAECKTHKVPPPPTADQAFTPEMFGLSSDTKLLRFNAQDLQHRESSIFDVKNVAHRFWDTIPSSVLVVAALDRSIGRWRNMTDEVGTIDSASCKWYLARRDPPSERSFRPLTVEELLRLQGGSWSEHYTPGQMARLTELLPHRSIAKAIGQMFHFVAELAHFIAALLSTPRLKPRPAMKDGNSSILLIYMCFLLFCSRAR